MNLFHEWFLDGRQLLFPNFCRVPAMTLSPGLEELARQVAALAKRPQDDRPPDGDDAGRIRFFADLSTHVWRLRQKMLEPGTDRPKESFRRECRYMEALWDSLAQAGIKIQEHTGKPFDAGLALKVLAYQPTPGINRERVQDTVKPTIYYQGKHIQMGEVIVESPQSNANPNPN